MELGLSLGDTSRTLGFLAKDRGRVNSTTTTTTTTTTTSNSELGFCMALGINSVSNGRQVLEKEKASAGDGDGDESEPAVKTSRRNGPGPPLPLVPRSTPQQPGLSWPCDNGGTWGQIQMGWRGFDVNRVPPPEEEEAAVSSPNPSAGSSLQMDLCIYSGGGGVNNVGGNKTHSKAAERASSRASDEEENDNGLARKKLRLSREQSAYLEESFKEQNTLNHKQKLALAKQLNLLPRQVEVWFQNRRARTKLKQTEVDCEYLKRCCKTLTEENRRLQKELHELRALKTSTPFYMQLPPTTLTMCPSCERIATITSSSTTTAPTTTPLITTPNGIDQLSKATPFPLSKPRFYPLSQPQPQPHQYSAAS